MSERTMRQVDQYVSWNEYMEVLAQSISTGLKHDLLTADDREHAMKIIDQSSYFRKVRTGYRNALLGDRELVAA